MPEQGYNAYLILEHLSIQDPLMSPSPRYHHILFIETLSSSGGHIFNVAGDLVTGMTYSSKPIAQSPELSSSFHSKTLLGRVKVDDFPERVDKVLKELPPPPVQRKFDPKTMRYEQVRPDGNFYVEGEEKPRYRKCTEWTNEQAIPALRKHGLLRDDLEKVQLKYKI